VWSRRTLSNIDGLAPIQQNIAKESTFSVPHRVPRKGPEVCSPYRSCRFRRILRAPSLGPIRESENEP
jgi:hypothetical protein